jgi:cholest-4-en-3-one 26-monooxygenase
MSTQLTTAVDDLDLADVDLFDLRWHRDGAPHELLTRMRRETPVRWNPLPDGTGCWTLLRHAEIAQVSRDYKTFSNYERGIMLHPDQVLPLDVTRNLLLYMDPPMHTKYRLILQSVFTPHAVRALEEPIRARVTRTIDSFIERGSADLVGELAVPIPIGVVSELLGVPDADRERFLSWTNDVEASTRSPEPEAALESFGQLAGYLNEQIARQVAEGRTDTVLARLRDAEVDGRPLNDGEILVFFGLITFAGHDTTRNTTSNGMHTLLEHPEALAELKADPSLIPGAVEEILRWTTVVQWFNRTATCDTELGGQRIRKGDRVVMWYPSASRDEDVFEDPQTFDIHRFKPDHDAFGGGGRHFCLGAGLARMDLTIIFEEAVRRLDDLELAGKPERVANSWSNVLRKLPVTFTPGPKLAAG